MFISRLPATFKECDRAIKEAVQKDAWEDVGVIAKTKPTAKRPAAYYKSYETEVTLYGETYRAVLIHSSAHDRRRQKRIEVLGLILLTSLLIWRLMERSMRQYVAQTGEKLPGWDRKPTDRPTSFMMTTKFTGIMVIKIDNERRLSKPLHSDQEAFLMALGINPSWLIKPQSG